MQKTEKEARRYAQTLANLHREPRILVKLPKALPGSARDIHGIEGEWYGGVTPAEQDEFRESGAVLIDVVTPTSQQIAVNSARESARFPYLADDTRACQCSHGTRMIAGYADRNSDNWCPRCQEWFEAQ